MKNKKLPFLLATSLLLSGISAVAQTDSKGKSIFPNQDAKRFLLGIQAGATTLHGDADKLGFSYAAGIHAQYSFSHSFGVRIIGNMAQLKGEASTSKGFKSYSFINNAYEGHAQVVATLGNISHLRKARKTNLYFFGGLGYVQSDATNEFVKLNDATNTVVKQSYKDGAIAFSGGLGVRRSLSKSVSLGLEYGYRYIGSDLVDVFQPNAAANQSKDAFSTLQLSLSFKLGKKGNEHVEFINPLETIYEDLSRIEKKVDELSKDDDGDGVGNFFDKDPKTPAGAKVYGNGEAVDTDGDGVPDILDQERNSPKGAKVDKDGNAEDSDKDGVPDVLDLSPGTDTTYMVNHQGIPIMTKELSRKLAPKGGLTVGGGVGYMPAILFETGSAKIRPLHYTDLSGVADAIKRNPDLKFIIIGNADFRGSEGTNDKLALRRAEAVKKVLTENFGVNPANLTAQSNGEKVPVTAGKDPLSLQANRRVQFFIAE